MAKQPVPNAEDSRSTSTRTLTFAISTLFLAACVDDPTSPPEAVVLSAAMGKTDVCHRSTNGNFTKISVADAAYETHIAHGDGGIGDAVPGMTGHTFDSSCQPVNAAVVIVPSTITAGGSHSCGLDPAGKAYCWGWNAAGQLGDGTETWNSLTPVAEATTETFVAIRAGREHTVALTAAGEAFAWGNGWEGQLGNGQFESWSTTPVAVATTLRFTAIDAGRDDTVALTAAGEAYAWGENHFGQLGDASTIARVTLEHRQQ